MASRPPALPRLAMIMENSPRETMVSPMLEDARGFRSAVRPASMPAIKLPINVTMTAASAYHIASPPSVSGSMDRPKLKKKMAPKKSRNGMISFSMRLACSVSASTRPISRAPMASATWIVSENPATRKSAAKMTMVNSSPERIFSTRFSNGTNLRPTINRPSI
ncbi:hypothetical protein D3C71_1642280 [compost metagenome]